VSGMRRCERSEATRPIGMKYRWQEILMNACPGVPLDCEMMGSEQTDEECDATDDDPC
jgi:hypothetical protein